MAFHQYDGTRPAWVLKSGELRLDRKLDAVVDDVVRAGVVRAAKRTIPLLACCLLNGFLLLLTTCYSC